MTLLSKKRIRKNRRRGAFSSTAKLPQERSPRGVAKKIIYLMIFSAALSSAFSLMNKKITEVQYMTEINRVSLDDLEAVSSRIYNQGFLQIDLSQVKQEIEAINWVKSASIERRWPDRINIFVEEEDIIGRWNNQSIINSNGNLFNLNQQTLPSGLIEFDGPDGQQDIVFKMYSVFTQELVARGILIERVTLDFKGSWSITIRPGITIRFGKDNVSERFERFLMIWDESLLDNLAVIEYIDLRYTEGFSIKKRK